MNHNFLNPIKPAIASLSNTQLPYLLLIGPRLCTSSSQISFTSWLPLGISKPSTSSSHLRVLYSSCRVATAEYRWGLTLACLIRETPEPAQPGDRYRPHRRTTTLPPHSGSSMERGGWGSVVRQPLQLTDLGKSPPIDLPTATKAQL